MTDSVVGCCIHRDRGFRSIPLIHWPQIYPRTTGEPPVHTDSISEEQVEELETYRPYW